MSDFICRDFPHVVAYRLIGSIIESRLMAFIQRLLLKALDLLKEVFFNNLLYEGYVPLATSVQ